MSKQDKIRNTFSLLCFTASLCFSSFHNVLYRLVFSLPCHTWLISLSRFICHHQNSVRSSFLCRTYSIKSCPSIVRGDSYVIAIQFLSEWFHRMQLFKEMPEKFLKDLASSFTAAQHMICQTFSWYVTLASHSDLSPLWTIHQSPPLIQHRLPATSAVSCCPAYWLIKSQQTGYWKQAKG